MIINIILCQLRAYTQYMYTPHFIFENCHNPHRSFLVNDSVQHNTKPGSTILEYKFKVSNNTLGLHLYLI